MNNNFKLSNATAMEYTIANIAGLSNAMRMQTPCIDLANSLSFANIAPSSYITATLHDSLIPHRPLLDIVPNVAGLEIPFSLTKSILDTMPAIAGLMGSNYVSTISPSSFSLTKSSLDTMPNITELISSASVSTVLPSSFSLTKSILDTMPNFSGLANAFPPTPELCDFHSKHFKEYEAIQERIQEFFEAADERQRQLNELLDNSALPLSQPLLPKDFLTNPEGIERPFQNPAFKKFRHRSKKTAYELCRKSKQQKTKKFYNDLAALPIAKLNKTNVEFLILILGFFKTDFYSVELQWLVNFLFTALAIRWFYLNRHSTSDK